MKVHVIDDHALSALSPRWLRLYLGTKGWQRVADEVGPPDIWALPAHEGTYEVVVPTSTDSRDFAARVAELLRTLSIVEDRSELDVIRSLTTLAFDVQYIRTHHDGPPGTAPLRDAASTLAAAHAMLAAAAASLIEPRLVLPNRRPARAVDLMKKVLAGPTEAGSYIVSIWVPIPPRLTPEEDAVLFDPSTEPYERATTIQLNRAIRATRDATSEVVRTDVGLDAFVTRESQGVSANICESLVSIAGQDASPFKVRFAWSLDRPVPANAESAPVDRVRFDRDDIDVLNEAARELRSLVPEDEVLFRGNVIRLRREKQHGPGDVTISGFVEDDPTQKSGKVYVNLAESDYVRAITAHETGADVEILGSIRRRGTRIELVNARGFTVRAAADD